MKKNICLLVSFVMCVLCVCILPAQASTNCHDVNLAKDYINEFLFYDPMIDGTGYEDNCANQYTETFKAAGTVLGIFKTKAKVTTEMWLKPTGFQFDYSQCDGGVAVAGIKMEGSDYTSVRNTTVGVNGEMGAEVKAPSTGTPVYAYHYGQVTNVPGTIVKKTWDNMYYNVG